VGQKEGDLGVASLRIEDWLKGKEGKRLGERKAGKKN